MRKRNARTHTHTYTHARVRMFQHAHIESYYCSFLPLPAPRSTDERKQTTVHLIITMPRGVKSLYRPIASRNFAFALGSVVAAERCMTNAFPCHRVAS